MDTNKHTDKPNLHIGSEVINEIIVSGGISKNKTPEKQLKAFEKSKEKETVSIKKGTLPYSSLQDTCTVYVQGENIKMEGRITVYVQGEDLKLEGRCTVYVERDDIKMAGRCTVYVQRGNIKMIGECTLNSLCTRRTSRWKGCVQVVYREGTSRWKVSLHSTVYVQGGDENGR